MKKNQNAREESATGRRHFFKALAGSVVSSIEEIRGKPQMSLAGLGGVPDDVLRRMVPVFNPSQPCREAEGRLYARDAQTGEEKVILVLDDTDQAVFDAIDGTRTVGQIARKAARWLDLDEDEAYRRTKAFFIDLACRRICLPSQAYQEETDSI